ncbi:MAG: adenylate/guanylate cyclase domain-containing protein [Mycobacterium sp.]
MDIAYQVVGDGPVDLLVMSGPFIPIDAIDAEPSLYRFHRRLASFGRVIRYDPRGIGLARVRVMEVMGPRFWAEDAIAVMDAVGCEQATIFASSYSVMSALVLAAEYPERVRSLVIVNGGARMRWAPDYPVGAKASSPADLFMTAAIQRVTPEQGFDVLKVIAPSVAGDNAFRTWWDAARNRAMSPSMGRAVAKLMVESDVRDILTRITAPTLILHRDTLTFLPVGHGRYLAEHIAGSRYLELPGSDFLYWVGDTASLLDEIEEFITGARGFEAERVVSTIVFTDIVGSTERAAVLGDRRWRDLLDNHDSIVRHEFERFRGHEVNTVGDGFVATFTSPSVAMDCAEAIVEAVRQLDLEVRVGVHTGEVEVRGSDVAGMAVHIGARVAALAGPSEVLVSSTVREIVTGSRRTFAEAGEHELKGVPGRWRLHTVLGKLASSTAPPQQ